MNKFVPLLLSLLLLAGCASSSASLVPENTTEGTTADTGVTTTDKPAVSTNNEVTTTVTESSAPETTTTTTAPVVKDETPAPPPVTEDLPPIDFTNLAGEYGFEPDLDPSRTWADMSDGESADPTRPMIAITFDDGPGPYTSRLLEILGANNAKATFFVAGYRIAGNEQILRSIADGGHDIGGHSWWHNNLVNLSTERAVADEIMMTRERIYAATGVDSRIVRPPYGSHNEFVRGVAAKTGVAFVNWNVDTEDWRTRNADAVYNSIISSAKDGAIILCHDIHSTTVDAMERAIPKLIEDGYQLVTVTELMTHSGKTFESGSV